MTRTIPVALAGLVLGLAAGVGAYTFVYAEGGSYLTNDPAACANCHVMRDHLGAWQRSSHRAVAVCNDCHTPAGLVPKYLTKASNGFWHSFAFTSGRFPEPLRIKPGNLAVAEAACHRCHAEIVQGIEGRHHVEGGAAALSCARCHASVGHLE
jgi:cytochrome c nitrite reductase small subunit